MSKVQPVPEGYASVTPSITFKECAKALGLYPKALGAEVVGRSDMPNGLVAHAEVRIGSSRLMVSDEMPGMNEGTSVEARGGSPVSFWLYVEDCDAAYRRAVDAGFGSLQEPSDMFWGDRTGMVKDPFGLVWTFATHVEDVSPEEMKVRMEKTFGGG